MQHHDDEHNDEEKSKSQLKREAHALIDLGEALVNLPGEQLQRIPLTEALQDAILLARKINQRSGRKRQLQYIGKLLRNEDATPIQEALDKIQQEHSRRDIAFHRLEKWRDRLIAEGDSALEALIGEYPNADRQHLRQLVRKANQEFKQNKPPAASRSIFRYLRDLSEADGDEE